MESKILNALGIDPAFIFLFMLILFVVLFILYVNVTMKYNRLKNSYATFMKGKDGKSLEQSLKDKFEEAEAVLKFTKQNRTEIRELNRKLETNYQKVGIVKYDAFNEMGGKLSFALAMLDGNDSGWIINAITRDRFAVLTIIFRRLGWLFVLTFSGLFGWRLVVWVNRFCGKGRAPQKRKFT